MIKHVIYKDGKPASATLQSVWAPPNTVKLVQSVLDTYIDSIPFPLWSYITYRKAGDRCSFVSHAYKVIGYNTNAATIQYSVVNHRPCVLKLASLNLHQAAWEMDDTIVNYRLLDDWEMENLIEPNRDSIQNHINKLNKT